MIRVRVFCLNFSACCQGESVVRALIVKGAGCERFRFAYSSDRIN